MSIFSQVATRAPGSNAFELSYEHKLTTDFATLTPFYCQEVVPGDRFRVNGEIFLRMAPTLAPIMHRLNVTTHYFYCPNRILWDKWQDFITGGEDGADNSVHPFIYIDDSNISAVAKGTLADYLGVPTPPGATGSATLNALPFRAYQKIYNEYYRDQNLQDKITINESDDGQVSNPLSLLGIRTRNWEKDYLTSALPFAQKGSPVVAPIGFDYDPNPIGTDGVGNNLAPDTTLTIGSDGAAITSPSGSAFVLENIDPNTSGIDVEELRKAVRLQEWLEKNARAGSRYVESIQAHFNERVPDYTAQRPIYLGGGRAPVNISEVLSTYSGEAANTHDLPQGNMSGHGVAIGNSNRFKAKFSEHGFIIGIMSVMPRTAYQQGLPRVYQRRDKFDYYWPEFAQLGEQVVFDSEAFFNYTESNNGQTTFGYQSRYAEMKYRNSEVSGDFKDSLSYWHMGRIFSERPDLNSDFVTANPREDIFAVVDPDVHSLYVQIFNNVKAIRKMPYHNVPTL